MGKFIQLVNLEIYQLARELSKISWKIFQTLPWQDRKIIGEQFIKAVDSVGANITEGYFRYHFLDKIKFYYNARASLAEAIQYWLELLFERKKIKKQDFEIMKIISQKLSLKLNNFIASVYRAKDNHQSQLISNNFK